MKKNVFLFVILVFTAASYAEDIGAVTLGMNNYIAAGSSYEAISSGGAALGLIVPVNFKRPVHLKLKTALHNVDADKLGELDPGYVLITNEVLVGLKWIENGNLTVLPQLGLGFVAERYRISKDNARSHGDFFVDLSCRLEIALTHFNIGALVNFERDFNIGYGSFLSPNRLNVALLIST